ncbi:MAG: ABC transporter permease [Cyclobacteriaceae bacterium]
MLKNHLIIAFRSLKRHSFYSFINIFGLAIGMAAGFMILQYVHYETSYDQFFENKENIYRIQTNRYNKGELQSAWAAGCAGIGLHMKEDFPEVLDFVNLKSSGSTIQYDKKYYELESPYYAGKNFFEVFSVPLLRGVDSLVLKDPFNVVLSESLAKKIFGDKDPIGEILIQDDSDNFKVTGVFQDFPEQSHMNFDLLYSFETFVVFTSEEARTAWQWDGFLNYVVLHPETNLEALKSKFPDFIEARAGDDLRQYDAGMDMSLQPLEDIHLTSNYRMEIKPTGNETTTYFLLIIGLFVLFIAWINYINLTTARSMSRAREVGIRKVLGGIKRQLISQFMFESLMVNSIALLIATCLVVAIFPFFNDFVGRANAYTFPLSFEFWLGLASLLLVGVLTSGFYPALVLSNFKPVAILKGKFSGTTSGNWLRKTLVVFQFLASVVLITGTFVVYKQMDFLQSQDLGVKINQTLVIETPKFSTDSLRTLRDTSFRGGLLSESSVKGLTMSTAIPGESPGWNAGGIRLLNKSDDESNQFRVVGMDDQFIDFYDLEIVAGRKFDKSYGAEEGNVLFNEAAVRRIGLNNLEDILNKKIFFWGDTFNVVGVVKNYRQESPKQAYDAHIFRYFEKPRGYYSINVGNSNLRNSIETVKRHWESAYQNKTFNYFFLDDHYNQQYESEVKFGSIFGLFAILAIFVACLGLFGLASYVTNIRSKEVGVRKVLGASLKDIWLLLTSDFLKLVLVSIGISIPISFMLIKNWLEGFENRIAPGMELFIIPAVVLVVIAVTTVSYHTIKSAHLNPVESLKEE